MYRKIHVSFSMHKAFAHQVMTTAMCKWGKGIVEAVTLASEVTGYSAEAIRKWEFFFFTTFENFSGPRENIDNEFVDLELSSNRGCGVGNQSAIIQDEEFQENMCTKMHIIRKESRTSQSVTLRARYTLRMMYPSVRRQHEFGCIV